MMEAPTQLSDLPLEGFLDLMTQWIECQPMPQQARLMDALETVNQMILQFHASRAEA